MQAHLLIEQIFKVWLGNKYHKQNKEDRNHIIFFKAYIVKKIANVVLFPVQSVGEKEML